MRIRTVSALIGALSALALGLVVAPSAQAATAAPTAPAGAHRAAALECDTEYGHDNRIHGYCSGNGAWTLHITCWPGIERTASTTTHGYSELSLGCGPISIQDWWITFP